MQAFRPVPRPSIAHPLDPVPRPHLASGHCVQSPLCDVVPSRRRTPSEHGSHRSPMPANSAMPTSPRNTAVHGRWHELPVATSRPLSYERRIEPGCLDLANCRTGGGRGTGPQSTKRRVFSSRDLANRSSLTQCLPDADPAHRNPIALLHNPLKLLATPAGLEPATP